MYLAAKQKKLDKYSSRKIYRFKVKWTVSDLNKF
jgi:hypothetical protein